MVYYDMNKKNFKKKKEKNKLFSNLLMQNFRCIGNEKNENVFFMILKKNCKIY